MSVGEVAGLIAAVAAVALVVFCAVPLLKMGRVLEELRLLVRDVGRQQSDPSIRTGSQRTEAA